MSAHYQEIHEPLAGKFHEQVKPSAPAPDVESLLDNATHAILSMPKDRQTYEHYRAEVERLFARARAPLVEALEDWLAEANDAIAHRNKRHHLSLRDWHVKRETLCAVLAII